MTYAEALALGTPIYVMFAVGTLSAGWLGDHLDLVAVSPGPASLMIGLGLLGLFAALYHPVGLALVIGLGGPHGQGAGGKRCGWEPGPGRCRRFHGRPLLLGENF